MIPVLHYRKVQILLTPILALYLCGLAGATLENAAESDTRSMSMGGATLASIEDAAAGLVNPAVLGFMNREDGSKVDNSNLGEHDFGWNMIDLGLGVTLTGNLGDYLETLGKINFSNFDTGELQSPSNVRDLILATSSLGNVSDKDSIVVSASAGSSVQIGHFGIGVRAFGQIGGSINNVDLARIGLTSATSAIVSDLNDAMAIDGALSGGALTSDQLQQLRDAFGAATDEAVITYLDGKVTELVADGTIDAGQVAGAVDVLSILIESSGDLNNLLEDNRTSITGRGFGAIEIPLSYGYAVNESFSIGLTAKAMLGRVYGTQVWVFNDSNTDIIKDSLDSSRDSMALGLDLAMMYRIPKAQFALVGRNLNRPSFSGYDQTITLDTTNESVTETIHIPDVILDPQVAIGAAFMPFKRWVLESDFELLETGTILNNYKVQRLSFGTEVDLSLLALRLGTYRNIAESDYGWVLTGGAGFNLWALSVDIGLALSINDTVNYDGVDYPRTARIHAGIGMTF